MPRPDRPRGRTVLAAAAADATALVVFCALGRRSHAEGLTVAGIAETAWPFMSGAAVGWVASRGWRRPTSLAPTGLAVWVCTVLVGMLLRKAISAGTAASFVAVAAISPAVLLLGWRGAVTWRARRSDVRLGL